MDADRAISLAAPTEQITQCKVKFGRFWVKPNDIDKCVDGPVRFFIKQVVQAPKIRIRKAARLRRLLAQISARSKPSEREQQRKDQQPPKLELHRAINRLRQRSRSIDTGRLKRARRLTRLHRIDGSPQSANLAALSKQGGDNGEKAERCSRRKESEQEQNQRLAPRQIGPPETQGDQFGVRHREQQQDQKERDPNDPAQDVHRLSCWLTESLEEIIPPARSDLRADGAPCPV